MDYGYMVPGGPIAQMGAHAAADLPSDLDFNTVHDYSFYQEYSGSDSTRGGFSSSYSGGYSTYSGGYSAVDCYTSGYGEEYEENGDYKEEGELPFYLTTPVPEPVDDKEAENRRKWPVNFWCDVCHIGLTTEFQMNQHMAGKTHEKKVKAMGSNSLAYAEFLRRKSGEEGEASPAISWNCDVCNTCLADGDQYQMHLKGKPHEKKLRLRAGNAKVFDYYCDLCNLNLGSNRMQYDAHLDGKQHARRLFNGKVDVTLADPAEAAYYCEQCKIQMENAAQYISHLGGAQHARRLSHLNAPELGNSGLMASTQPGIKSYWCDICKIAMSGHQPFQDHMNGSKHKQRALSQTEGGPPRPSQARKQKPSEFGGPGHAKRPRHTPYLTGLSAVPQEPKPRDPSVNKRCDVCNKSLPTRSVYDAHMAGQAHAKKAKMLQLMGGKLDLPKGTLGRKILDTGPMIKDGMLCCVLCDLKFNKLALALAHFPSRKHQAKMKTMEINFLNGVDTDYLSPQEEKSTCDTDADASAPPIEVPGPYSANFVSGGSKLLSSIPAGVEAAAAATATAAGVMEKSVIDAKIKEARDAAVRYAISPSESISPETTPSAPTTPPTTNSTEVIMDTSEFETESSLPEAASASINQVGDAEAMDLLVREISPHDTSAIVCSICSIGVSTTQMLSNHVVGMKHIKRVVAEALDRGEDISGMQGRGVPFRGRGRGRGWGPRGGSRGRRARFGRGFPQIYSASQMMAADNDGSSYDYRANYLGPGGGWSTWLGPHPVRGGYY